MVVHRTHRDTEGGVLIFVVSDFGVLLWHPASSRVFCFGGLFFCSCILTAVQSQQTTKQPQITKAKARQRQRQLDSSIFETPLEVRGVRRGAGGSGKKPKPEPPLLVSRPAQRLVCQLQKCHYILYLYRNLVFVAWLLGSSFVWHQPQNSYAYRKAIIEIRGVVE
jgi:hypothetical protein